MDDSVSENPATPGGAVLFDHVAIGVREPTAVAELLVGTLGGEPVAAGPGNGFLWYQWRFGGAGVLEVLEPDGPGDGFLYRFLDDRGAGIHHVTFKVPDHARALERARELGYAVVGVRADNPGWKEAFLHPKQAQGIVVQIVENPRDDDEDDPAWSRPFPTTPAPARVPAALLGLRCVSRDPDRARTQWAGLLGARCDDRYDTLVFRWPESPMRIAVEIDPDRPEGPIGLEWSHPGKLPIAAGPHPLLGTAVIEAARSS